MQSLCRAFLVVAIFTSPFIAPVDGNCGPVFDRIMKTGTVRLALPYNLVPQGFLKQGGEWVGFQVDLASEMVRHMNLKVEEIKATEKTWGPMLNRGAADAAMCRIKHTRSLDAEFDFSVAYFYDSTDVLVLKGSAKTASDLKGKKIGAIEGSASEKAAMRLLRDTGDEAAEKNVVSFPDRPSCFMALGKDQVSGWIDSGMILLQYAAQSPGRFELVSASGSVEAVAVALPQNDSAWRDLVNFTIQDMAADGSLQKIYDKWFGPSTPHPFPNKRTIEIWPE